MSTVSEPGESPTPSRSGRGAIDCDTARRLTAAFVQGGIERRAALSLNRHTATCESCLDAYKQALQTAGRLGANLRERREPAKGPEDPRARRERIVRLANQARVRRRKPFALRAALVTASMVFLFGMLSRAMARPEPVHACRLSGDVRVGDTDLGAESDAVEFVPATWCSTGVGAKARLSANETRLELGGDTAVLLEDRAGPSFLLRSGSVVVDGPCQVLTVRGAVRVKEGTVRIQIRSGVLELESFGGRLALVSSTGTAELGPGDPVLTLD